VTGAPPPWTSRASLQRHFNKHGPKLGVRSVDDYDKSARDTIRSGARFTYMDRSTRLPRVGRYDPTRQHLTILTDDESAIVNHFAAPEHYVRNLPASTYP
jgi:hypothetical protein